MLHVQKQIKMKSQINWVTVVGHHRDGHRSGAEREQGQSHGRRDSNSPAEH